MAEDKQTVLIVDDIKENLDVLKAILIDKYRVKFATSGEMALKISSKIIPDIILLDIMMPEMDGFTVCKILKKNPITQNIPVIFVTADDSEADESKGFSIGCVDYIRKPVVKEIVLARVKTHLALSEQNIELERLVREKTFELRLTQLEIIKKLGIAAEFKDNETGLHITRMSQYCFVIAKEYGFQEKEADLLLNAAPMHDVGKIGIPDSILKKPDHFNENEWIIMKTHSLIGSQIIGENRSELLKVAKIISKEHHERWDGTGYPYGLKGENINIYARITSVADVFDALTSKRPYKDAWSIDDAINYIKKNSGIQFDPKVVEAFYKALPQILEIKDEYGDE